VKRTLALRRWWIAGFTVALVVVRIAIAAGIELFGSAGEDPYSALSAVTAAFDVLCIGSAVVTVVAFVQYGRIFKARVPTE
jgi:hypothetical protein